MIVVVCYSVMGLSEEVTRKTDSQSFPTTTNWSSVCQYMNFVQKESHSLRKSFKASAFQRGVVY